MLNKIINTSPQNKLNLLKISHKSRLNHYAKFESSSKNFKTPWSWWILAQTQPNFTLKVDLDTFSVREQESNTKNYQNKLKISISNLWNSDLLPNNKTTQFFWVFHTLDSFCEFFDSRLFFCGDFLRCKTKSSGNNSNTWLLISNNTRSNLELAQKRGTHEESKNQQLKKSKWRREHADSN